LAAERCPIGYCPRNFTRNSTSMHTFG
jgi:hypothetical protein